MQAIDGAVKTKMNAYNSVKGNLASIERKQG
jgi:hypothetical protein